jgi:hypothetical protein
VFGLRFQHISVDYFAVDLVVEQGQDRPLVQIWPEACWSWIQSWALTNSASFSTLVRQLHTVFVFAFIQKHWHSDFSVYLRKHTIIGDFGSFGHCAPTSKLNWFTFKFKLTTIVEGEEDWQRSRTRKRSKHIWIYNFFFFILKTLTRRMRIAEWVELRQTFEKRQSFLNVQSVADALVDHFKGNLSC